MAADPFMEFMRSDDPDFMYEARIRGTYLVIEQADQDSPLLASLHALMPDGATPGKISLADWLFAVMEHHTEFGDDDTGHQRVYDELEIIIRSPHIKEEYRWRGSEKWGRDNADPDH